MLNKDEWKKNIEKCLIKISDLEFQKKYWLLDTLNAFESFDEVICMLFDDLCFYEFIKEVSEDKNNLDIYLKLNSFYKNLNKFIDDNKDKNFEDIYYLDEWRMIVYESKSIVKNFNKINI